MKDTDIIDSHPGNISLAGRPDSLKNSLVGNFKYAGVPKPMYSGTSPEPAPPPPPPAWNGNEYTVSFDGAGSYMKCDNNFATLFRSSFSVSFWIKFNDTSGTQILLSSSNATAFDRIQFWHDGTVLNAFYEANDVSTGLLGSGSQTWTNWNHIVATFEQSGSSCVSVLYVNGSSVANKSTTLDMSAYGTVGAPPDFLVWAARALATSIGFYSNVKLDEMAFFGSALSASDVSTIYSSGVPADISSFSPAHWWRMGDNDGGSGDTITDKGQGSDGVDGVLINSPTFSTTVPS